MKNSELISKLTLEEKVGLCSGKDFWNLKGVERLGIPEIMVTDGPHGLRKKNPEGKGGLADSVPTTCFPTAATTACSWDPELLYEMGVALGEECLQERVSVILGPGVNMKRSPLCGRNFEYFSEDPLLAGELAAGWINGVQSQGVGTSLKHFAVNSQERKRMIIDSVVDERALREIYLTAFEIAVKKAQPWTVMNSYNKINGTYASDNDYLQNKILRDEWGFEGIVVSDWGAVSDRVVGFESGNDLEMPSSYGINDKKVCDAVRSGEMSESVVDRNADRMLTLIKKSEAAFKDGYTYDKDAHHKLASEICSQSIVLLKNEDALLPIAKDKKIAVIGEMARAPRYQGAGSSLINPTKITDAFDALIAKGYALNFAPGYNKKKDEIMPAMIEDACKVAKNADVALVFVGLTEEYESEGYDREHMNMPSSHNYLVEEILKVNENVVVVLSGGSPVEMPWVNKVRGLVNGYLGGQASGDAIADIICGDVCPSGKLAETYPKALSDVPCRNYYPGTGRTAEHTESIYIGYRYYDTAEKDVLFPFGFGLSYTEFKYSNLKLSKKKIKDTDTLTLSYKIKNVGKCDGAEISQVYVADKESTIFRPKKELKGFKKVFLKAGEETTVEIELSKRAFAFYNINSADWQVESGEFEIMVGASSRDIKLTADVYVESTDSAAIPDYRETAPSYYGADVTSVPDKEYEAVLGRAIPARYFNAGDKYTTANSLGDAAGTKWGAVINSMLEKAVDLVIREDKATGAIVKSMILEVPIRNFVSMSSGVFTEEMSKGLLMILNGEKSGRGLAKMLAGFATTLKKLPDLLKSV
jgi:beta-glucosidase